MPETFASLLVREHIFADVPPVARDEVFREILDRLVGAGAIGQEDSTTVLRAVLKRERAGTTGIGRGIGVPHCKTSAVAKPLVAFARTVEPIEYGAADGDPVQSVFLVVSPSEAADLHVSILRWIATFARDDYVTRVLRNTSDPDLLFDLFREYRGSA